MRGFNCSFIIFDLINFIVVISKAKLCSDFCTLLHISHPHQRSGPKFISISLNKLAIHLNFVRHKLLITIDVKTFLCYKKKNKVHDNEVRKVASDFDGTRNKADLVSSVSDVEVFASVSIGSIANSFLSVRLSPQPHPHFLRFLTIWRVEIEEKISRLESSKCTNTATKSFWFLFIILYFSLLCGFAFQTRV